MRSMIWTDIGVSFHSAFSPIAPDIDNKQNHLCFTPKTSSSLISTSNEQTRNPLICTKKQKADSTIQKQP